MSARRTEAAVFRRKGKRVLSVLLAASLMLIPARTADETGHSFALTESSAYTETVFSLRQRQEEHYVSYTPGGRVFPDICYGSGVNRKLTLSEAEKTMRTEGKRVIAAINGDYFVVSSGEPVGIVVRNGELVCSDDGNPAIGFLENGETVFGSPGLQLMTELPNGTFRLGGINRSLKNNAFCLYTPAYGSKTPVLNGQYLVLRPENEGEKLRIGMEADYIVDKNESSSAAVRIDDGTIVLCLTKYSEEWRKAELAGLQPGDRVGISVQSEDPVWNDCALATGSLYKLITEGKAEEGLEQVDAGQAPRTAVGRKEDGTVLFYTVDGRQDDYSGGLTLAGLAERLLALGCTEAGALDGGGSTGLWAQLPGEDGCSLLNRPSMGTERAVSTLLLLITEGESSGELKTLSIYADSAAVLAGAELDFRCGGCDEAGVPVPLEGVRWSAEQGSIDADGGYTAPAAGTVDIIRARVGEAEQSFSLSVVEDPDEISVFTENGSKALKKLVLNRGEEAELSARARWRLCDLTAADENFVWTCDESIGTIDRSGRFRASDLGGTGTIRVSAGSVSTEIEVAVRAELILAEDFEAVTAGGGGGMTWSGETNRDLTRSGLSSLRLDYDLTDGSAEYPLRIPLAEYNGYMHFWLYGDGSDNSLFLRQNGIWREAAGLDCAGWKLVTVKTGLSGGVNGLRVQGSGSGSIRLDRIVLSESPLPDLEPPVLRLETDGPHITGSALDWTDGALKAEDIALTVDGEKIPFRYDGITGELEALAEDNGRLQRVTLTARDISGNVISVSAEIEGETGAPFPDMAGHWAEAYAGYLYGRGIINGKPSAAGTVFDPDAPVTRAEFAVMLMRWLGTAAESEAELPFADSGSIPEWAEASVSEAVRLGLIKGSETTVGLFFFPNQSLSRAEAATILGRTLEAGRMSADICFDDFAQIPQWALQYVGTLSFLGCIRGYDDGCFHPSLPLTRAQAAKILTLMS